MDDTTVPEQQSPASSEASNDASLRRGAWAGLWGGVLMGGIFLGAVSWQRGHVEGLAVVSALAIWAGGTMATFMSVAGFLAARDELRRVSQGRERVREAEQGLERALRPSSPLSNHGGTVVVHGDLVLPRPDEQPSADRSVDGEAVTDPVRTMRSSARLTLSELWAVTHRRLDLYHEIALGQASRSFRNAQIAMVLGFALLVGFVLVALQASTTAGSVVVGGLGAVAAGLAGYVSRTFVRSQEASAGHLRAYFDQPLEFSRYLAAERLIADAGLSEERRAEVLAALVEAMVAGNNQAKADAGASAEADRAP